MDSIKHLPGMTEISSTYSIPQIIKPIKGISKNQYILIATQVITDENIFMNGLFQNILILYEMFELLGFSVILLTNRSSQDHEYSINSILRKYRSILPEDIILYPMEEIYMYIEIGMSVSPSLRDYIRNKGSKIVKLYLGNILNIDIETIQMTPSITFPHHISGVLGEIWTSPHYEQNREYAAILNQISVQQSKTVPYLWEPHFITQYHQPAKPWTPPPSSWILQDLVIVEPNISFQKSYFFPLLLANAFSEKYPEWHGNIYLFNSDPIVHNVHAQTSLIDKLSCKDRIKMISERKTIIEITTQQPSSLFICHQYNNDFNYMTLELLYLGFPVLHTSNTWKEFGYYWNEQNLDDALQTLRKGFEFHSQNLQSQVSQSRQLYWHHSIYNPQNYNAWATLLV